MTKKVTTLFLSAVFAVFPLVSMSASADCGSLKSCEKKFCEIESQLSIAQEKGNKQKVSGLKKALKSAKDHCTDKGFKAGLLDEIEEISGEIVEYESNLKEAEEYGKKDKVQKYQEKIEEEKSTINLLKDELSSLD